MESVKHVSRAIHLGLDNLCGSSSLEETDSSLSAVADPQHSSPPLGRTMCNFPFHIAMSTGVICRSCLGDHIAAISRPLLLLSLWDSL